MKYIPKKKFVVVMEVECDSISGFEPNEGRTKFFLNGRTEYSADVKYTFRVQSISEVR